MCASGLYTALPSASSIRLLQLHPSSRDDEPLSCSLHVYEDYRELPPYLALSYCWGHPRLRCEIICNDQAHTITETLHSALCQLRAKGEGYHTVWADAICIDQDNIPERNQQVSIMLRIYGYAQRVLIWGGPQDARSSEALLTIRQLASRVYEASGTDQSMPDWLRSVRLDDGMADSLGAIRAVGPSHFSPQTWRTLWEFYQGGWFFRVWVIQEVRQCADVFFMRGDSEIDWHLVALTATWLWCMSESDGGFHWKREHFPSFNSWTNVKLMWELGLSTRREAPFLMLLSLTRPFEAIDPRDKIFALLHHRITRQVCNDLGVVLAKETHPLNDSTENTHLDLKADYSMSKLEVYRNVAVQSIRKYNNLEVLCYAWQAVGHSKSKPSWIPRWDVASVWQTPKMSPFLYNAAGGMDPMYSLNPGQDVLSVRGINLGTIPQTSYALRCPPLPTDDDNDSADSATKRILVALAQLLTHDRFYDSTGAPGEGGTARCCSRNSDMHFAAFASDMLRCLEGQEEDCYVSLYSIWCNHCLAYFSAYHGQAVRTPTKFYSCKFCDNGEFDLCVACYDKGVRCEGSCGNLELIEPPCLWLPYAEGRILRVLREHAIDRQSTHFREIMRQSCRSSVFFEIQGGRRGSAWSLARAGDVVAVLFGCRVPAILRPCGGGGGARYRLVSVCYMSGFMDGEAVEMWKDGLISDEAFEIV